MTYRIIATLLLLVCIVAAGVALEYDDPSTKAAPAASAAPAYAPSADDSAMQSLRIP